MAKTKRVAAKAQRKNKVAPPIIQSSHKKSSDLAEKTIRRSLRIAEKSSKLENDLNELYPKKTGRKTKATAATNRNQSNVQQTKAQIQRSNKTPTQTKEKPLKKATKRTFERKSEALKVPGKKTSLPISTPIRAYKILDLPVSVEKLISSNGTLSTGETASNLNVEASATNTSEVLSCTASSPRNRNRRTSILIRSVLPLIRQRTLPFTKDVSNFQRAKELLHLSVVPKTLPCREKEMKKILEVIKSKLLDSSGGSMYVSGVPGSGKSATVAEVIRSLQLQSDDDGNAIPRFELIQINGMHLAEPQEAYVQICHHLSGRTIHWNDAVSFLDQFFIAKCSKQRKLTILVIDEFDMLKSPRQRVIYNLLNWAMMQSARLFLVAIGNIVNLEQMGGIASRLGATRFTFQPYTQSQLQSIVQARLAEVNIYEKDAIELIARKVASISGDCRRALDICRRAIEICEKENADKTTVISMSHVIQAFDEMISSNLKVIAIKGCSKYEKLFLQAVVAEIERTGADETVFYQVYRQFETICLANGASITPEPGIALRISSRLGASRLLVCDHSNNSIHQKIVLNVTSDEIRYAYN